MSGRTIIRGGFVLSPDPEIGEIPAGEGLVEDGKIAAVGCRSGRR
jgi:5-methylthioadenosine/S-adenosylhomocysteine deaminase